MSVAGLTPEQLRRLRELMTDGKVPDDRLSDRRVFHHGWNEGIDFVEMLIKRVTEGQG